MTAIDAPPKRVGSAEKFAARAMAIVDEALTTTAEKNERGWARGRVVVCSAFLLRQILAYGDHMLAGSMKDNVIAAYLVVAIALSLVYLRLQPRAPSGGGRGAWPWLMTAFDVSLFVVATLPVVLQPEPDYAGILMTPFCGVAVLINVGAGMRLHRRFALASTVGTLAWFVVLCAIDRSLHGDRITWDMGEFGFYFVEIGASGVIAFLVAHRVLDVAARSAEKAIEAERARERLGAYVGREVAEEALAVDEIVMGGTRQAVAVLFSDLRGFTTYSERLAPEQLVQQLNNYLEEMVAVITRHGGVVDKYIGDGIMAVFGAPRSKGDDARRAIDAARGMQAALVRHNARRAMDGLGPLKMGVGVHYGSAIAGNVGTMDHAQYTIIGDTVNLASRLESATKDHNVDVLLSREAVEAAGAGVEGVEVVGTISVKGREQQIEVFTLAAAAPAAAPSAAGPTA